MDLVYAFSNLIWTRERVPRHGRFAKGMPGNLKVPGAPERVWIWVDGSACLFLLHAIGVRWGARFS
jgi:hypothetical protein